MPETLAIIDYGSGNLRSATKAFERAAAEAGLDTAVLSGGVFQNRLLLTRTATLLREAGLRVLIPERLPPNDGGIAYGQAAVAAAELMQTAVTQVMADGKKLTRDLGGKAGTQEMGDAIAGAIAR